MWNELYLCQFEKKMQGFTPLNKISQEFPPVEQNQEKEMRCNELWGESRKKKRKGSPSPVS